LSTPVAADACRFFFERDWNARADRYTPNAYEHANVRACGLLNTTSFSQGPPFPLVYEEKRDWDAQSAAYMAMKLLQPGSSFTLPDVADTFTTLSYGGILTIFSDFGFTSTRSGPLSWIDLQNSISSQTPIVSGLPVQQGWTATVGWAVTDAGDHLVKVYDPSVPPTGVTRTIPFAQWFGESHAFFSQIHPKP
jgi:hypothetical protein